MQGSTKYSVGSSSALRRESSRKITPQGKNKTNSAPVALRQVARLLWRFVIFAAAIAYVTISLQAGIQAVQVLHGVINSAMTFVPYESEFIKPFVGTTVIRQSPLLDALGGDTGPRDDTLFLVSPSAFSFDNCSNLEWYNTWMYGNAFMRDVLADFVRDTAYNFTFLEDFELILPVVDCSFGSVAYLDDSISRIHYLMRRKTDHDAVTVLTFTFSMQDYLLADEHQLGASGVVVMTLLEDVRATKVDYYHAMRLGYPYQTNAFEAYQFYGSDHEGFWVLESIPRNASTQASMVVRTASRTGFYANAETEQSNIKNLYWELRDDPIDSMSNLPWAGNAIVRDSWAWVHGIHFFFAADTLFNVFVLLLVVYQNLKNRKFWMGDAFVSVTSTLEIRGALVLASWYMNGFWVLMEFCLQDANDLGSSQRIFAFPQIIRADLLTIYMTLAGIVGHLFHERVDPALVVFVFEIGFEHRKSIAQWFAVTKEKSLDFASYEYMKGLVDVLPKHANVSPYRLWSCHHAVPFDAKFIAATLWPVFASFVLIIAYATIRKLYRRAFPDPKIIWSKATGTDMTGTSSRGEALTGWKSSYTVFEIATGAPLQNRVGLASDYDNCIYIKGMKYASPDGIYCNGYVIMAGKYLVCTEDMLSVVIIVLTRFRFRNVYVYDVEGHKVQQTARLVYPEMLKFRDLFHLNISILS